VRRQEKIRSGNLPRRELCRWNESLDGGESVFDTDFSPTPANLVVYHLHGHTLPESLVLTEDDYLSFLANIARNSKLLGRGHSS
jgi:hypothetical protein